MAALAAAAALAGSHRLQRPLRWEGPRRTGAQLLSGAAQQASSASGSCLLRAALAFAGGPDSASGSQKEDQDHGSHSVLSTSAQGRRAGEGGSQKKGTRSGGVLLSVAHPQAVGSAS